MRLTSIAIFFLAVPSMLTADGGWRKDSQHPQLEYRFTCLKGTDLSVHWRSGYPGAVSFKARIKSETYDGVEQVRVLPDGTALSSPETMSCSLGSLSVSLLSFSMAAPPPPKAVATPKAETGTAKEAAPPPPVPGLIRFDPNAEKLPEISPEKLAQISTGMTRDDVIAKLGPPASKLSVQNDGEYVESYQYRLGGEKIGIVRFSNGAVTEITPAQ